MVFKNGNVFIDSSFIKTDIKTENGIITEIGEALYGNDIVDCPGKYIIPGLVDIHTHGCAGFDFSNADLSGITRMTCYYAKNGITSVVAATVTMNKDDYEKAAKNICRAMEKSQENSARIIGINMEGPFLGKDKKGAHDERFLIEPDEVFFNKVDELSDGKVLIVNIDPNYKNASEFIRKYSKKKIISLAHTSCSYETAVSAFNCGAGHITHLFNAMNPLLHREPGLIGAFFDRDDKNITAELICDGFHVESAMIRIAFRLCSDRIALISDSMSATGLSDGNYTLGGLPVFVRNSKATLENGVLAGSATNLFCCLKQAVKFKIPIEQAIQSATRIPAKIIGKQNEIGEIKTGLRSDLLLLDRELSLEKTFILEKEVL